MKKIDLFEHNEIAYKKLCEKLSEFKCATINHATGLGKSFIALKYLYENRDKKALYISPTYPIIEQLLASCSKIGIDKNELNLDTMIYMNLLKKDMKELYEKYDIFIFDEYHRAGAKRTYKKMKKLKKLLDENDDKKKFIGLTATPIRYLDNERVMTDELFDGIVASKKSLAEAMIEGLLPIPYYINSKKSCLSSYKMVKQRLKCMADCKKKFELEKKLEKIEREINLDEDDDFIDEKKDGEQTEFSRLIKNNLDCKNGKYIVFCENAKQLVKERKIAEEIFENENIKKYSVYSYQSKEKNQEQLNEFNDANEGLSVLYCINILNEGVHVEGIDAVILKRKTTSPIIFFQQIGRLLSFSGRKRNLKIIDEANNIENHKAITEVFKEFEEEINRLLEIYPERTDELLLALDKFKIVNRTKNIQEKLDEIKEELTSPKIMESKIDNIIETLESSNSNTDNYLIEELRIYNKYITMEQFKKLFDLNIELPTCLSMTVEEREKMLMGYTSIFYMEESLKELALNEYLDFINENKRFPLDDSNDIDERKISKIFFDKVIKIESENSDLILDVYQKNNLQPRYYEKVFLKQEMNDIDFENMISKCNEFIEKEEKLPDFLYSAISKLVIQYNNEYTMQIFNILEKVDEIKNKEKEEQKRLLLEKRIQKANALKMINEVIENSEVSVEEFEDLLTQNDDLVSGIQLKRIIEKFSDSRTRKYGKVLRKTKPQDIVEALKDGKSKGNEEIEQEILNAKSNTKKYSNLKKIISYIIDYKIETGDFPEFDEQFELYEKDLDEIIDLIENDVCSTIFNPKKIVDQLLEEQKLLNHTKEIVLRKILFIKNNRRNTLNNSSDEEERELALEYDKLMRKGVISSKMDNLISNMIGSKESLKNTTKAFLSNLKKQQSLEGK